MRKQMLPVFCCSCLLVLAITSMVVLFGGEVAAGEIRIGGTGSALGTMRLLGEEFDRRNIDINVTVLPSIGSSGVPKALSEGAIDIGLVAQPLTEKELKLGLNVIEYARTPLVFAVPVNCPIRELTLDQIAGIYRGTITKWTDGSRIRPVLRQAGDSNTRQIKETFPSLDQALSAAEQRPGMIFAMTDQEACDKAERVPGAICTAALSTINSENRRLRVLTLDGTEPTIGNIASGTYPLIKRLFIITRSRQSAEAKLFIAFMRSPAGRDILARTGNMNLDF